MVTTAVTTAEITALDQAAKQSCWAVIHGLHATSLPVPRKHIPLRHPQTLHCGTSRSSDGSSAQKRGLAF